MSNSDQGESVPSDETRRRGLPRRLGRYVLLSRLDAGGMTEVYSARLAEEVGPGRLLVIKVLPHSSSDDPDAEVRFLEEARIVLNLTHGNITTAFEFGREEGRPFLVLEYVPGPSLRQLLDCAENEGHLAKVEDALFVVREVSRALSYAHSFAGYGDSGRGIIHRDISPDNILISTAGQVKLTDFGIAQFMHSGLFGAVWGKAAYIAPEVAAGETPSPASDIYSLGAVLYECLTGTPPLRGEDDNETLDMVRSAEVKPPSSLRPDLPVVFDETILQLLSKDPAERSSSAAELEVSLSSLLRASETTYTGTNLAETVGKCFPDSESFDPSPSDHIRAGIFRAGLETNGEDTGKLLATATVPLGDTVRTPSQNTNASKDRRGVYWVTAGLVLLTLMIALSLIFWPSERKPEPVAPKNDRIGPVADPTPPTPPSPPVEKVASAAIDTSGEETEQRARPNPNNSLKKKNKTARTKKNDKPVDRGPKPPNEATEWGWLNINSSPWSYVSVDGKKLKGHTPYRRVKLSGGSHTLVFENPSLGLRATKKVNVRAWEEANIGVRLE